jgi:hypothetical protein
MVLSLRTNNGIGFLVFGPKFVNRKFLANEEELDGKSGDLLGYPLFSHIGNEKWREGGFWKGRPPLGKYLVRSKNLQLL